VTFDSAPHAQAPTRLLDRIKPCDVRRDLVSECTQDARPHGDLHARRHDARHLLGRLLAEAELMPV